MLDVRRFFQDKDDGFEVCVSQPMPANRREPIAKAPGSNVHLLDFSQAEAAPGNERFPRVDEIVDRLDINVRVVGGSMRRSD